MDPDSLITSPLHIVERDKWSLFVKVDSTVVVVKVENRFFDFESILKIIIRRVNAVEFQNFDFRPKLSFLWKNHKNNDKKEFLDFSVFILYMILKNFHKNNPNRNRENHI